MVRRAVVTLSVLALVLACSSTQQTARLQVRTDFDESTDFSTWKTFRLASTSATIDGAAHYPRYEKMVRDALIAELTDRGYQRAENGSTDFRVASEIVFSGSKVSDGLDSTHGIDTAPVASTGGRPTATLRVKMLHPGTSQVLWQGELPGIRVDAVAPEADLRKAVWRLLVEFPPISR
jgi:hypothetical protein